MDVLSILSAEARFNNYAMKLRRTTVRHIFISVCVSDWPGDGRDYHEWNPGPLRRVLAAGIVSMESLNRQQLHL